jgi:hypothetical protein
VTADNERGSDADRLAVARQERAVSSSRAVTVAPKLPLILATIHLAQAVL